MHGVVDKQATTACLAEAGTLLLEFGALSRLSGLAIFEVCQKIVPVRHCISYIDDRC
jgi:hypothetical protein